MPAYFGYVETRLSGGHQPGWSRELLDVLRSVLRRVCNARRREDPNSADVDE